MNRLGNLTAAAVVFGAAATLAAGGAAAKPSELTVYGGPLNTSWYIIAGWLANELNKNDVRANSELGGSVSNIIQVGSSPAKMGFAFAATAPLAAAGGKPFPKPIANYCSIQIFHQSAHQVLVAKDSGITEFAQLKGKTFSIQPPGNLSNETFADLLKVYGMSSDDLTLAVGGQQFGADGVKDRRFVGFSAMSSYPSPPMLEAATSVPVNLLPVPDDKLAEIQKINPGYNSTVVPAQTYPGQDTDVQTFGTAAVVIMNDATTPDDQYFITKLMHSNWDGLMAANSATKFLTPKIAAAVPAIPLCPGAQKYWGEAGAI